MNQHRCKSDSHRYSPKITDGEPARFFLCAGCRAQVLICSDCDRGQIYCNEGCAREIRRRNQREAGRRYQRSSKGRANHAERSRRYRARRRNVTHQGPPQPPRRGRASGRPAATVAPTSTRRPAPTPLKYSCYWCGCTCSRFVRQDFWPPRNARRSARRDVAHHRPP
jgi:hypothetical protein